MKQLFKSVLAVAIIFLLQQSAMGADSNKIAVLDLQKCMQGSNEGKRSYLDLTKKRDSMRGKLDAKQDELKKLKSELEKQGMMLSLDAKEDKQKAFETKRREFEYLFKDANDEMKKAETAALSKIFKDLEKIIQRIGKDEQYDLILDRKRGLGILYSSEVIDLTERILEEYNKLKP